MPVLEAVGLPRDTTITLLGGLFAGLAFPLFSFAVAELHLGRRSRVADGAPADD